MKLITYVSGKRCSGKGASNKSNSNALVSLLKTKKIIKNRNTIARDDVDDYDANMNEIVTHEGS